MLGPTWPVACSSPPRPMVVEELQRCRGEGRERGEEALVGVVRWGRSHDGSSTLLLSSSPAATPWFHRPAGQYRPQLMQVTRTEMGAVVPIAPLDRSAAPGRALRQPHRRAFL